MCNALKQTTGRVGAGVDPAKDQSYFLFATTPEQLAFLRFPLGMSKDETRDLARRYGLAVSEKPDSQDICFVPNGRYGDVVRRLRPGAADAGDIRHLDGTILAATMVLLIIQLANVVGWALADAKMLMSQKGRYMSLVLMLIAIQCLSGRKRHWPAVKCIFMMLTGSMDSLKMAPEC